METAAAEKGKGKKKTQPVQNLSKMKREVNINSRVR